VARLMEQRNALLRQVQPPPPPQPEAIHVHEHHHHYRARTDDPVDTTLPPPPPEEDEDEAQAGEADEEFASHHLPSAPSQPERDPVLHAKSLLAKAQHFHRRGQDEDAVELIMEWLDRSGGAEIGVSAGWEAEDGEMVAVQQAMVALGCWLCNALATGHLIARRVARAFGYTRACQRWLALQRPPGHGERPSEMWLRLRFDQALNAAELAQTSDDLPTVVAMLRECERLQAFMEAPAEAEAVHICLAEALLRGCCFAEAARAAQAAAALLGPQQRPGAEGARKVYSMLFALSLEQSALGALEGPERPPPERALQCLPDAEAAWLLGSSGGPSPADEASLALLERMSRAHCELVGRWQVCTVGSGAPGTREHRAEAAVLPARRSGPCGPRSLSAGARPRRRSGSTPALRAVA